MSQRVKFLRYMDSYRLIYRFEWDIVAVTIGSGIAYFIILVLLQSPIWLSPLFAAYGAYKTLKLYKSLVKEAAPGYLEHFVYSIGLYNPTVKIKKNGKYIKTNSENIPFGFENDFRD
ncbi:hypothetical protein [Sulfurimonas sp.]|uniref:hypothetical protein n=1 Tax=Sulfurimonas sp. TaxID=2022749 RepID=UPI0025E4744D|nr:hypothetical protein [Sulfurimonas sp.]MBW6487566.1 hypothetical protein [Sulfurimonas sp.]